MFMSKFVHCVSKGKVDSADKDRLSDRYKNLSFDVMKLRLEYKIILVTPFFFMFSLQLDQISKFYK